MIILVDPNSLFYGVLLSYIILVAFLLLCLQIADNNEKSNKAYPVDVAEFDLVMQVQRSTLSLLIFHYIVIFISFILLSEVQWF